MSIVFQEADDMYVSKYVLVTDINRLMQQQSPNTATLDQLQFEARATNRNVCTMLAMDGNRCVGMGTIIFFQGIGPWMAEIHDLVVDQDYRGSGIGRSILNFLLVKAREFAGTHGRLKLSLTSRPSRVAANSLYASLGFLLVAKAEGESGTNLYRMIIEP